MSKTKYKITGDGVAQRDSADILARCKAVKQADEALGSIPSAASLAYDHIVQLEATIAELREVAARLSADVDTLRGVYKVPRGTKQVKWMKINGSQSALAALLEKNDAL